jgi:hypothetical protein
MLTPFLTVALHELGTRNSLLGPLLNNTEVYWTPFIITTNHTIAGYNYLKSGCQDIFASKAC